MGNEYQSIIPVIQIPGKSLCGAFRDMRISLDTEVRLVLTSSLWTRSDSVSLGKSISDFLSFAAHSSAIVLS